MAQETAPATTPEIDTRWTMAMYGRPTRIGDPEHIFLTLTKRFDRVERALQDLAAMLVDDGVWEEEMQEALTGQTWAAIETLLKAWAARAIGRWHHPMHPPRGTCRQIECGTSVHAD